MISFAGLNKSSFCFCHIFFLPSGLGQHKHIPADLTSGCSTGELSYLATTLGSENISAPYFKQYFFQRGGVLPPPPDSQTPRLPVPRQK